MMSRSYEELSSCQVAGVPVRKYRSLKTGLVVCTAQVDGPLVNGYFCLATEAHDHDGLPHTLEHLIFMGSEQYPYKGVLDLLANRCLAQGTNAWTDVDHTCYTMTMAGSDGFLNLLPVYLDHILYPTLTDSAYLTEVHHINGQGDDAGVVYCEMQARENTSEDRTHFRLVQHMYPGRCGYKSETGGRMENLRDSCSNQKVQDYHKSYYRPDNLCLIVTGQVEPELLFKALHPFEERILSKGPLPPMPRPWQSEVPPLLESVEETVPFPTDEEDDGLVRVTWRGPSALNQYALTSIACLLEYLSATSVAPLQKELVEIKDPYCCEIEEMVLENAETCIGFKFCGVPTEKLGAIAGKVVAVLGSLAGGTRELDVERMTTIIKNKMIDILNQVEEMPHYFFAFAILGDFLFSKSPDQFPSFVDQVPRFKKLLTEPPSYWVELIKTYFIETSSVVIRGCPSSELSDQMEVSEKVRISQQADSLGKEGLKRKSEELDKAVVQNEIASPTSIINSLPVPGTDSIHFHPIVVMGNHHPVSMLPVYPSFPVHQIPFFMEVDHIKSAFIKLTILLDTAVLPTSLLLYVPLFLEMLFESPLLKDGVLVPHETVVKDLESDTVDKSAGLGASGSRFSPGAYSQAAFIEIKVEAEKYDLGVQWLKDILYNIQFTKDRLLVVINKMTNDVSRFKRKGSHIAKTLMWHQIYQDQSSANFSSMLTQLSFLNSLTAQLKDSPHDVIAAVGSVRDRLTSPENLRLFMAADVPSLTQQQDPLGPWRLFLPRPSTISPPDLVPVVPPRDLLRPNPTRMTIAGVGGVDSNFLVQVCPCITSQMDSDLPAIMVFIEYLCALEGPMWRQIRGMGLSYNYRMLCRPDHGHLYFQLFKSSQLVQAYKVAKEIMQGYLSGATPFEQLSLEAAVSGVIYELIEREKTVTDAASQAILGYLRQLDSSYSRNFLSLVSVVTLDDLRRVGEMYFSRLFDPLQCMMAVCCSPGKVEEVKTGLEGLGCGDVEVVKDLSQLAVTQIDLK